MKGKKYSCHLYQQNLHKNLNKQIINHSLFFTICLSKWNKQFKVNQTFSLTIVKIPVRMLNSFGMPYTDILRTKGWSEHIKSKTPSPSPYSPSSYLIPTGWNKIAQKIWQAFLIVMQVINSYKITRVFTPFTWTNQHAKSLHLKPSLSPLIRYNCNRYFTILLMWWIQCSNLWSNGNLQSFSNNHFYDK